jgi:cell volume regulation protein A
MPASIEIAKHTLLSAGIILAIGTVAGLLAQKVKIPDVAVFPIVGMMVGPQALGLVDIKADSALNQIILLFGASYILFDGGLAAVIGAYFAADDLQASGFTAVFVFGIVFGNQDSVGLEMRPSEAQKLAEFVTTTAFIMRLFIFILLGAQLDFRLMSQYLLGGVFVIAILIFVARPISVFLCALPDRRAGWTLDEMVFMCWTRETGVIPAAMAGLLLGVKAPGAHMIASVTFIAVLMTILLQAPTTKWLAGRLNLLEHN